jgi:single-strand DNA-binding protein
MGQPSNLVVLTGTVTSDPTRRSLRSGVDVVNFDVATSVDGETASVPVAWYDPRDSAVSSFEPGEEIVVVGSVRRRFFRVGGQTQSRTEVVVATLVPTRRAKSTRSALAAAAASIMPGGE